MEIVAAVVGTMYIQKYREDRFSRYFVYFLWFIAIFDTTFGWLPTLIGNYKTLAFLRESFLAENQWAYNLFDLISFSFYLSFFTHYIESLTIKRISKSLTIGFVLSAIIYLVFSGSFFDSPSLFGLIIGTFLLVSLIILFYLQILQSETILNFYKFLPFYISIGALVFHVVVNPIFIYGQYYEKRSPEFIQVYRFILTAANIFMYTCYIIGFIICSKKKKSYSSFTS
ncbi:hypothetical protein EV197_2626 [Aquimarina brevivitae]|uniref:Uncharacterized protein n=1 Tax=Aquimarina brevivitae TaxID=323412 RepID=A0A4Q7NZP5_9FLAO|nr:hypothetical protein EV197_2626 [Aquimarina brevivitae]